MKKIHQYINNLQNGVSNNLSEDNIDIIYNEMLAIIKSKNYKSLVDLITKENFYSVAIDIHFDFLDKEKCDDFLSKLWYEKMLSLPLDERSEFLLKITDKNVNTFGILVIFEKFMYNKFELSSEFFTQWFIEIAKFVKNDMANFKFYNGIAPFTENNPDIALDILNKLIDHSNLEITNDIASIILGTLRYIKPECVSIIEQLLKTSNKIEKIKLYYMSFLSTFYRKDLTCTELQIILDQIINTENIDIQYIAFLLGYKLSLYNKNEKILNFIFNWYIKNTNIELSEQTKYYCILFVEHFMQKNKNISGIDKILSNIKNISENSKGTIHKLYLLLNNILQHYPKKFKKFFRTVLANNDISIVQEDYFLNNIIKSLDKNFYTELFFSSNYNERIFAQKIYIQNTQSISLNKSLMMKINDTILELIIKELLLSIYDGNTFAKLIIDINSRIDTIKNKNLLDFLEEEIIYQCINYREGCFNTLNNNKKNATFVKKCLTKIVNHFNIIDNFKDSPALNFNFADSRSAILKGIIKQNKEVQDQVKDKSLLSFVSNVELIYGSKHAHRTIEGLSESAPFQKFGASYEIPILDSINPISQLLKRIYIDNDIKILRDKIIDE